MEERWRRTWKVVRKWNVIVWKGILFLFAVSWHHSTLLQTHWASVSLKSFPVWFVFVYVLTACVFVTRDTIRHPRRFVFGKFVRKPNCSWSEAFVNRGLTVWENTESHNDTKQLTKYDETLSGSTKELWEGRVVQRCQPRWWPSRGSRNITVMLFHEMQSMAVMRWRFQTKQPTREIPYQWCRKVIEMIHDYHTDREGSWQKNYGCQWVMHSGSTLWNVCL